ncbi:hypothetical protein V8C37DRAFT_414775 [Trichoderma ceciliae]
MPFRQRMARHFGDSLSPEKPYLSYYDVLLTIEDIKSLKNDWLTDNNIAFWEEYLEHETLPRFPQARIILLRPSMTFLLMKEPDMRHVRSALPDFSKVTHVFLPINDNRNVAMAEGGSHWSLLLVSVLDGIAFHYDSLGGANYAEANLATRKLSEIVQRPIRFVNLEDSPQQENGSDCGVFVCLLMRHLLVKRLLAANAREKVSMSMAGKMVDSNGGRKEMLHIIESLRKEGERRRSRNFEKLLHQAEKEGYGTKQPSQRGTKKLPVLPDDPKEDDPKKHVPGAAARPTRPATRAKTAGKGQLESSTAAKHFVKSGKSPRSKSSQSSQSTPSPIRRMRRIVHPPRDANKPTALELKFASNKGLKRTSCNSPRPVLSAKPVNAMPVKDRGLRAALE